MRSIRVYNTEYLYNIINKVIGNYEYAEVHIYEPNITTRKKYYLFGEDIVIRNDKFLFKFDMKYNENSHTKNVVSESFMIKLIKDNLHILNNNDLIITK